MSLPIQRHLGQSASKVSPGRLRVIFQKHLQSFCAELPWMARPYSDQFGN
jgi:hypothetical protein